VGSVDIYPTILDAAGIELPEGLHGRSLRPVLQPKENVDWREILVGEFHYHGATPFFPRRAITDGRYKLIHNIRAGELNASNSVDGDSAWQRAQELRENAPARLAMNRLANPPQWELYDLQNDPIEFHNRAGESEFHEIETRLKASLATWQKQTNDRFDDAEFRRMIEAQYKPAKSGTN
jgi:N-sulfoglucosamine sulfohydrolase